MARAPRCTDDNAISPSAAFHFLCAHAIKHSFLFLTLFSDFFSLKVIYLIESERDGVSSPRLFQSVNQSAVDYQCNSSRTAMCSDGGRELKSAAFGSGKSKINIVLKQLGSEKERQKNLI